MKILHLSDLHFKNQDISQNIVLSSLSKYFKKLKKDIGEPNLLIITGDIAYSGKAEEYGKALEFINEISTNFNIKKENIFIIPGNHDVDRSKIAIEHLKWWYSFNSEHEVTSILNSDDAFPKIIAKCQAYNEFSKNFINGTHKPGKFGQYISEPLLDGEDHAFKVKIVGLNSSIFSGYEGDDQKKLALGLEQLNFCELILNSDEEIVISCVHHPVMCFHSCDKASLNTMLRFSDIVLSGHVHEVNSSATRGGNSGETILISSGACYEKREQENGFNIIDIDLSSLKGKVTNYKYLYDDHEWILNKDHNHATDGVFHFDINNKSKTKSQPLCGTITTPSKLTEKYIAKINLPYDDLNRETVEAILDVLKTVTSDVEIIITKMERGSIKIYFETTNEIVKDHEEVFEKAFGKGIIEIQKESQTEHQTIPGKPDKSVLPWITTINPEFLKTIHNPGATFNHSREDDLELKDLFVAPNLRIINTGEKQDKLEKIVNSENSLSKKSGEPLKIVVYGSDSSGKSTLVRWWYYQYYSNGYIPILISGSEVKDITLDSIKKLVQKEFSKQYNSIVGIDIEEFDPDRIIVIVDDFHRIRFANSKYKANLISNLYKGYQNLFIIGNDLMQFETYNSKTGIIRNILEDFSRYQLIEFGPKLRYELIKKWNSIGIDQLEPNELIRLNIETERYVESIIGKNFVPSYPLYLLTILQSRELTTAKKPEYSLHGFYYELLINEALNKAVKNKDDIGLYYNFITDYCYFLFDSKIRFAPLFINDYLKFHLNYCEEYDLVKVSPNYILDALVESKLITKSNDTIAISYKYIYYFFVAKYLANNISNDDIKVKIKALCQRVHRDEFASIVMFLTHLSKDQFILKQLLENSKSLFSEYKPIRLEEDVTFINNMISQLPEHVYEPIDVEKVKEEELKEEEELELQEKEFDVKKDVYEYDLNEDILSLDTLSKLIKAMKTIEILGQVTKKYWGELKAKQKYELAEETYMLGLRTLGFHYSLIEKDTEILVDYLKYIFRKKHLNKTFSKEQIDKASRNYLFGICVMSSYGIVKRITNSIGYEKLEGTFQAILSEHNFTSVKLIDTAIKLDYNKSFPWKEVKLLKPHIVKHFLANEVLRQLAINYLYVFYTTVEDKQKICATFGITLDQQRLIDATSNVKKETPK